MTRSEFYEKIRQYESKWGKLGESKPIMHSEEHCEPEVKKNTEETLSVTEEYKIFRKKVAEGRRRNTLIHTTVINPEELNARYQEELFKNGTLIHSDINKYYRKVDLGNGNWRYFYSKEEYDAYVDNKNKQGASKDNAQGKGAEYQKWLNQQKTEKPSEEGVDGGEEKEESWWDRLNKYGYETKNGSASYSNYDTYKENYEADKKAGNLKYEPGKKNQPTVDGSNLIIEPNKEYEKNKIAEQQKAKDKAAVDAKNAADKTMYSKSADIKEPIQVKAKTEGEEMAETAKKTLEANEMRSNTLKNEKSKEEAIKKGYESTAKSNKMTEINNNYDKVAAEYNDTANEVIKKYKLNDAKTQDEYNKIADNIAKDMYKAAQKAPYDKVRNADRVKVKFEEGGPTANGYKVSSTVAYIPELDKQLDQLNKDYTKAVKSGNTDKASEIHDEINAVTKEYYYYCLPYMTDIMKYM